MVRDEHTQLTALYDAHAVAVWRYVVSLTGDHAGADDVVQETLLRAWRTPRVMSDDPASLRSWMYTVARNIVIDEARSARRRHELPVDEVPDRVRDDDTDAMFDALLVEEALATLTPDHRAVIVSAYYGGRSVAQAAEELGIPAGTVKSRLNRGRAELAKVLRKQKVLV